MGQDKQVNPDMVVLVADASNLKRNLLFVSQIIDLKIPVIVALTMLDIAKRKDIEIDIAGLERELGVPVIPINPRKNKGVPQLKKLIDYMALNPSMSATRQFIDTQLLAEAAVGQVKQLFPAISDYKAIHYLINHESFGFDDTMQSTIEGIEDNNAFNHNKVQAEEILQRYQRIGNIMKQAVSEPSPLKKSLFTERLDNVLLHRRWGYLILLGVSIPFVPECFLDGGISNDGDRMVVCPNE